ncbi:MAG: YdcF family protein [Deltaproteobacteria bacterium]|nr:YdcF family protein [Deltaproteobacteria bacterium]
MKFIKYSFLFMVVVGTIIYLAKIPLLQGIGLLLRVDNATRGGDALVVLSGNPWSRVPKAAQLHRDRYAPKIIVIDREKDKQKVILEEMGYKLPDPSLLPLELLEREQVSPDDIIRISTGGAGSTLDEARILKQYCHDHSCQKIILVTTFYHTSRARWIFGKIFKDSGVEIQVAAAGHSAFNEKNWWRTEEGFLNTYNEYLKWAYYLLNYSFL